MRISYIDIRDEAVNNLKETFKSVKGLAIEAHPGVFDVDELKRVALRSPAVLTSLMDVDANEKHTMKFSSWVIVRATNRDKLFDAALGILTVLIPALKGMDSAWSEGGASDVVAHNLFSNDSAQVNVGIWVVSWNWKVREESLEVLPDASVLGGILLPDALEDFEGYDAEHKVGTERVDETVTL